MKHHTLSEKVEKHLFDGENTKFSTTKIGAFHVPPIILRHTHVGYSWFYIPFYPMISHCIPLYPTIFLQTNKKNLVGGIPTPLKHMSSSVGMMIIPNICKNKKCSKPPTRNTFYPLFPWLFCSPFYPLYIPIKWLIFLHPTPPLTSWLQHSHPPDCSLPSPRSDSGPSKNIS